MGSNPKGAFPQADPAERDQIIRRQQEIITRTFEIIASSERRSHL
jgi:hypothetical protein